ncbi:hypothetical protein D3C86_1893060 [compost metagenome]
MAIMAPTAGSKLSRIPNVGLGRCLSATISSEYGSALDMMPTTSPASSRAGSRQTAVAGAAPNGSTSRTATSMPSEVAWPLRTWATRWPVMM